MNKYQDCIGIVGSGIAGLSLACILKESKIPVIVFEKSKEVSDYGAGVSISPNGIRVLKYLNIYDDLLLESANPKKAIFSSGRKKINSFDVDVITTSRKTLYKFLYKKYKDMDGEILFDHELTDIDTEKIKLSFNGNKSYKVSHIAACDGIKSLSRKTIDHGTDPIYSGYSVWRAVVEKEQKNIKTYLGPNHHIVTYPVSNSKISFVAAVKTSKNYQESWRLSGTYTDLKKDLIFANHDAYSFIHEETPLYKWGVYIRPIMKNITYKNLTLLGDAAHPIVPFIGQGGCLALEDAYIYGKLLIKYDCDINKTQNAYEVLRIKRIKTIANMSLRQGRLNHISNPIIVFLRNFVMKRFPSLAMRSVREKIWSYDPEKEIRNFK